MMENDFGIIPKFDISGRPVKTERTGCGHINDTYAVSIDDAGIPKRYILQRINHHIFKDPVRLMDNICGVTEHIAKKYDADDLRHVLRVVKTKDGQNYCLDSSGNYWRIFHFIENATAYQTASPSLFQQSGVAFGRFANQLADYPAESLYESIPDFHNTRKRYEAFAEAAANDIAGRSAFTEKEIRFAERYKNETGILVDMLASGRLPLRVTHNDTKLNNVMIDNETGEAVCVIDLDTVMPGLLLYDFGDSIRFGASTAEEDEWDISKVSMSLQLFENYAKGYLSQARPNMTPLELELLPFASKIMTLECGIRFLTDYLNGDVYFKTDRPGQNLDRCRTQFKLVEDMESKLDSMSMIIKKYS